MSVSLAVNKIDVLDYGFVRLVDHMGSDVSIARAARVSYDAAWRAGEDEGSDKRLVNYLWKNRHTTPFESVTFTFEVKAPIFVFRQWHRHRTWSFNELSARYKELPEEFYIPEIKNIGVQSKNNKQGRDTFGEISECGFELANRITERKFEIERLRSACESAFITYHGLIKTGWPRELARMVLPLNTYSQMFCTVDLLNLLKFIRLRSDSHAQYEIQVYSNALEALITPIVPVAMEAFNTN